MFVWLISNLSRWFFRKNVGKMSLSQLLVSIDMIIFLTLSSDSVENSVNLNIGLCSGQQILGAFSRSLWMVVIFPMKKSTNSLVNFLSLLCSGIGLSILDLIKHDTSLYRFLYHPSGIYTHSSWSFFLFCISILWYHDLPCLNEIHWWSCLYLCRILSLLLIFLCSSLKALSNQG